MTSTDIRRKHLCYLDTTEHYGLGDIIQCDECGTYFKLREVGMFSSQQWTPMTRLGIWWAITRKAKKAVASNTGDATAGPGGYANTGIDYGTER